MRSRTVSRKLYLKIGSQRRYVNLVTDNTILGYLTEHLHWIKPRLDTLQADLFIDFGNCDALNLNRLTMGFNSDLLPLTS